LEFSVKSVCNALDPQSANLKVPNNITNVMQRETLDTYHKTLYTTLSTHSTINS